MRRSTGRRVAGPGRRGAGPGPGLGRRRCRQSQDLEDPGRRRLPFGAGMELGPGPAERDEDLRGDQQHGHRGLQAELAPQQAQAQDHGHEADAESGDQVHGEGGEEGHPQRAHGGDAHPLGGLDHLAATVSLAPEGAQRRQSLDELEEPPGQRTEAAPLACRAPGRLPAEVDHGDRHGDDQRHHDDQREPVLGGHPDQEDERHHGRHGRLGEVAGEVGVERAQAAGGGERELAGSLPGQPAGPEGEHLAQQLSLQRGDDRFGRALGRAARRGAVRTARATTASATAMSSGRTAASATWCRRDRSMAVARATAWTTMATAVRAPMTRAADGRPSGRSGTRAASSGGTRRGRPARAGLTGRTSCPRCGRSGR